MTGKAVPVFTGKNPGPNILAAWAEQECQDAKAAAKEAEYWGNVGDIKVDLDTLDLTTKPALSPDHPDYQERERENAKLVDLAEWREGARTRAAATAFELPKDRPAPPPMIQLNKVTDETRGFANAAMEYARELIASASLEDDVREVWRDIASELVEAEFFSMGGLSVDPDGADWEPLPDQAAILDQFATDHRDAWPGQAEQGGLFAWYDARQMLRQEKWAVLKTERAAAARREAEKAERKAKDDRPVVFRAIDNLKLPRQIGRDDLYQKVFALASKYPLAKEPGAQLALKEKIAADAGWPKKDAEKVINEACKNAKAAKPAPKRKKGDRPVCDLSELGHRTASEGVYKVMTDQGDNPRRFHNGGRMTEVLEDESGNIRIAAIDKPRFKGGHIEEDIDFTRDGINVPPPDPLVNRVFNMPLTGYPPLFRITGFPTYSVELSLVMDPGYHTGSGLYHQPKRGVTIPPVPEVPTFDEMREARDALVDLFADLPLDARTRAEITAAVENGEEVPSLAHLLSVALTPIMRDTIEGPTPNHLATKDKPRTGASLSMSAASSIGTFEPAAPQSLPDSRSEVQKTLTAIIDSGAPYAFFDNIPEGQTTESDELAGAITAYPEYSGRRLGETSMVKARVTQTWLTTGIRTQLSEQLRERTLLIELDPKMERPGERPPSTFKYVPLIPHIQANAGRYMHALLTLVQYWKAQGCPKWEGTALGGFEAHAQIIGGILACCGIRGFMGNRDKLRARMAVAENPETELLNSMIEEHHYKPTLFRVWSKEQPPKTIKDDDGNSVPFEYARCRVVSVQELLVREQIAITKWGYDYEDGDVIYPSKAKPKVTYHFGAMENTVREWRDAQTEDKARQGRFVLTKVHKDKHGTLYRLEQLPLIGTP